MKFIFEFPEVLIICNFAEIHAVDVFGSSGGGDSTCQQQALEYHLIVKSHPQNEDAQRFLQPGHTFDKEVGMYGQVRCSAGQFKTGKSKATPSCLFLDVSRLSSEILTQQQ